MNTSSRLISPQQGDTIRNYVLAICLVIGLTVISILLRHVFTLANYIAAYLLVIVVIAIYYGTGPALLSSLVSFLGINFFLVPPYYTFLVADPQEVPDLVVFLLIALLTGQLASSARQQGQQAQQSANEQATLYKLTERLNQLNDRDDIVASLLAMLKTELGAAEAVLSPQHVQLPRSSNRQYYVLLKAKNSIWGTLIVTFTQPPNQQTEQLLNICASQTAMALQRVELAERLSKSLQYEEADRLKTAILHAVSHDLRTPITIIKTSASNLYHLREQLSLEEQYEITATIVDETDRLARLINELLDLSRLNAGAVHLNLGLNSLQELAEDVMANVFAHHKQELITLNFPPDMPLVAFDYGLMLQALTNIVDNALRYEPPNSKIVMRGDYTPQNASLAVINHGETIPAEERSHLMEAFHKGKHGNIGLGLAIAKGIVDAHHGRLWVEDTPMTGATFVIELPCSAADQITEGLSDETKDIGSR